MLGNIHVEVNEVITVESLPFRSAPSARRLFTCVLLGLASVFATPANATVEAGQAAYERGDYPGAFAAWEAAASAGNPDAQYALAALYSRGRGVARNHELANQWYLTAAKGGQVEAQYRIGMRYRNGDGLPRDFVGAYVWLRLATKNGHRKAASALKRVAAKLTLEQRANAVLAGGSRDGERRVPSDSPLSEKRALIRQIQTHLLLLGFNTGAVDGFAGGLTVKALRSYQRQFGMEPNGRMTAAVLDALKETLAVDRGASTRANTTSNN